MAPVVNTRGSHHSTDFPALPLVALIPLSHLYKMWWILRFLLVSATSLESSALPPHQAIPASLWQLYVRDLPFLMD